MKRINYDYQFTDINKIFEESSIKKLKVSISPELLKFKNHGKKINKETTERIR